jgi:hypothetical protein
MSKRKRTPRTRKVRRDATGGKRGDGNKRTRRISRPDPRRIRVGKPDPNLSSVAGLVMFGAFLRAIAVDRQLRETFGDMKNGQGVVYPMAAQLRMLIDLFVLGEHRIFGLEALSADPLFVYLCGGVVPSIDTAYRDLKRFDEQSLSKLEEVMAQHGLETVRRTKKLRVAHLDIDTTVEPIFGDEVEGALPGPNPHYRGRPSYHPVLARIAETDTCVGALLRPGDTGFGADEVPLLEKWIDRARQVVGPDCLMYVRIDAAGDCTELMHAIAARGCFFLTKAKMTPDLCGAIVAVRNWRTVDWDADGRPLRQVATVKFARDAWKQRGLAVRVVAVRTRDRDSGKHLYLWDDLDYTVQAFLTNDVYSDEDDLAARYNDRAGIEPLIGEFKSAWGIGKVPTNNFEGNHAALLLKLLAHNLLRRYVAERVPELRSWRAPWLRRALILVPGRLRKSGRRRSIRMPNRPVMAPLLN